METWNERLARAIEESEYTPNAVAKLLKVSAPTVSAWIGAGQIKPANDITANNLFRVCSLIGSDPEWILYRRVAKRTNETTNQTNPAVNTDDLANQVAVNSPDAATAEKMKQEISAALSDEGFPDALLLAIFHMVKAGLSSPVSGDQHHTKTVELRNARGRTNKGTGTR